jgi:hypothetical protein
LAIVRPVATPPGGSSLDDEAVGAAELTDRAAAAVWREAALGGLPLRPVSNRLVGRRIRCMDDPEILERVLEGLVKLV